MLLDIRKWKILIFDKNVHIGSSVHGLHNFLWAYSAHIFDEDTGYKVLIEYRAIMMITKMPGNKRIRSVA